MLLHLDNVVCLPCVVEVRLIRAVEPDDRESGFARYRAEPVLGILRLVRSEVDVDTSVCVNPGLIHRIDRGQEPPVVQARGVVGIINRDRPEQFGGDARRQTQLVGPSTLENVAPASRSVEPYGVEAISRDPLAEASYF